MQTNKVCSYIGFALKSGKVLFGIDSAERYKKKAYLIVLSCDIAENSFEKAIKLQNKFKCDVLQTTDLTLSEIVYRENCKFIAITDKGLSDAIRKAVGPDVNFRIYPWEEKE